MVKDDSEASDRCAQKARKRCYAALPNIQSWPPSVSNHSTEVSLM